MSDAQLRRLLLRLAIVFVGLQIAAVVLVLAVLAFLALDGSLPRHGSADLPERSISVPPR